MNGPRGVRGGEQAGQGSACSRGGLPTRAGRFQAPRALRAFGNLTGWLLSICPMGSAASGLKSCCVLGSLPTPQQPLPLIIGRLSARHGRALGISYMTPRTGRHYHLHFQVPKLRPREAQRLVQELPVVLARARQGSL